MTEINKEEDLLAYKRSQGEFNDHPFSSTFFS